MKGKAWTKKDLEMLYELSYTHTPHQISKKMSRTVKAVTSRQELEGIKGFCVSNGTYISARALANILDVDPHTVIRWKNKYDDFPSERVKVIDNYVEFIVYDKILAWLKKHQDLFDASGIEMFALTQEPEWLRDKRTKDYARKSELMRECTKWTPAEENRLAYLIRTGKSINEIAKIMQRTVGSIYHKKARLGIITKEGYKGNHAKKVQSK